MGFLALNDAAELIAVQQNVAFATETVYGLAADATSDIAVARIFDVKGRPSFNPLIVHFAQTDEVTDHVYFGERAELIASAFWPGPLTLVLKRKENCAISKLCSAGGETLAVRIPAHEQARSFIKACGVPLAAPSANTSGKISPTQAAHVTADFGEDFPILEGDHHCAVGLESTVLDLSGPQPSILRPGAISAEQIEAVLGEELSAPVHSSSLKSPGLLTSHYAPDKPVRLNADHTNEDETFIGFADIAPENCFNLSASGSLLEAASNLFNALHWANGQPSQSIAVAPIPSEGIGIAINDRLQRAAAER